MYEEDKDRNWNREPEEERPKKGGILKKAAWITAGALLFGTIAGGVMVGVQIASSGVFKNLYAIVSGEPEAGDWKAPEGQKPPADAGDPGALLAFGPRGAGARRGGFLRRLR